MQTRKLIVAGSALIAFIAAGSAEAQTWRGPYLSAHIGKASQAEDTKEIVVFDKNLDGNFSDTINTAAGANAFSPGFCAGAALTATPAGGCVEDDDGIDFGARLGYDWQRGSLVFGLVAEASKQKIDDSVAAYSTTPAFYTLTREVKALGALRARVGFGAERFLIYGTGGLAAGDLEHRFATSNTANTFTRTEDGKAYGLSAGGGLEFRLMDRVTLSGEYLFTRLDDTDKFTVRAQGPVAATNPFILTNPAGTDFRRTDKFEFHSIRAGLNFRF